MRCSATIDLAHGNFEAELLLRGYGEEVAILITENARTFCTIWFPRFEVSRARKIAALFNEISNPRHSAGGAGAGAGIPVSSPAPEQIPSSAAPAAGQHTGHGEQVLASTEGGRHAELGGRKPSRLPAEPWDEPDGDVVASR